MFSVYCVFVVWFCFSFFNLFSFFNFYFLCVFSFVLVVFYGALCAGALCWRFVLALCAGALCWRFVLALCAGALWCVLPCNSWTALQLKLLTMNTGLQLFSGCNKRPITLRSHDDTTHTLGPVFNIPTVAAAYKVSVAG